MRWLSYSSFSNRKNASQGQAINLPLGTSWSPGVAPVSRDRCPFLLSCIHVSFRTHSLLILLSIIVTTKKNLPSFWSSKVYTVISFMPETRNISDCSDTGLHSQGFHFRNYSGNSEWWALRMESVQNPHYLVLCMKNCLTVQDQGEGKTFH